MCVRVRQGAKHHPLLSLTNVFRVVSEINALGEMVNGDYMHAQVNDT